jgi:hypothetical protein
MERPADAALALQYRWRRTSVANTYDALPDAVDLAERSAHRHCPVRTRSIFRRATTPCLQPDPIGVVAIPFAACLTCISRFGADAGRASRLSDQQHPLAQNGDNSSNDA